MAKKKVESTANSTSEVSELKLQISSPYSDIGDWKIVKILEYRMMGYEDPYDLEELHKARQAVRDQINLLEGNETETPVVKSEE
ncbi:hypothetical protein [Pseudobutyrivibrio ruminis]|uniref:Uncharacterized protein n=1 Tax=Pseudobutyrivibrio ruminis TaxID=46206 RepID=A0A2G3DYA1_9FIRM|nr:hypothetical protein [Pseudobutyrivibrio ruminis]PHU35996.1 hypothetical protein CSX01_01825 [Pseudobutyrivibrio ruminis]